MAESMQHKLDRVRPPRVQITYDVEIGDSIQMKELPFVGGIMADLVGKRETPLPKVKDRKFIDIDRDNFNGIMKSLSPRLAYRVKNKLSDDNTQLSVDLKFSKMDDFNPTEVVQKVKPLKELFDARQKLSDLLAKLDGNDELDEVLQKILSDESKLNEVKTITGSTSD